MGSEGLFISQLSSSPPLKVKVLKTTWKKIAGRLSGKKIPGTGLGAPETSPMPGSTGRERTGEHDGSALLKGSQGNSTQAASRWEAENLGLSVLDPSPDSWFLESRPSPGTVACQPPDHFLVPCLPLGPLSLTEPEGTDAACRRWMKHTHALSFNLD